MKPIVKICLVLSGILFLLGITGVGVGMAMGASPSRILYSEHFPGWFFLHPDSGLSEIADPFDDLDDIPPLSGNNPSGAEEYYEFQDIQNFQLDLDLCRLQILSHEEDYIAVCADNVQNYFQCSQKDDLLLLTDHRPASTKSNSMDQALRLDLCLPERLFDSFCLNLGTGDLTLDFLSAKDIEINHGVGTITIRSLSCQELDIDAGIGELQAESIQSSEKAAIDMGTSNIILSSYDGKNLDLNCGLGNAEVLAVGRETDYNYQLEAALGSIYLSHHEQENSENHHNPFYDDKSLDVDHDADRDIRILCSFGNAQLNFTEE